MTPVPPRNPQLTLEEEAMAGSTVQARQEAQRRAIAGESAMPSTKELKAMPADVRARLRDTIAAQTAARTARSNQVFTALEEEMKRINDSIAKTIEGAAEAETEAKAAAAEGEAALKAGNVAAGTAANFGIQSGDTPYSELPDWLKELVNQLPQYKTATNAGVSAAIAALQAVGVEGLASVMEQIRNLYPDISSEDALMLLKYDKRFNTPYLTRFAGNKALMDAGFAPLDDKEYLATEKAFDKVFSSYELKQFNNRDWYSKLIGNRVSADELAARVTNAYERVVKGAAETKRALNELFPELNDSDILAYAIDPVNQLPAIQRKIQAAEIGGAALAQNLSIGMTGAPSTPSGFTNVQRQGMGVEQLMAQGVDLGTARQGFAKVAEVLPTAEKLSAIYGGRMDQYGRLQAEQEQFQGLASAKRARQRLTAEEEAQFAGTSGRARISKNVGGQI